jgi:hypothetical protein
MLEIVAPALPMPLKRSDLDQAMRYLGHARILTDTFRAQIEQIPGVDLKTLGLLSRADQLEAGRLALLAHTAKNR